MPATPEDRQETEARRTSNPERVQQLEWVRERGRRRLGEKNPPPRSHPLIADLIELVERECLRLCDIASECAEAFANAPDECSSDQPWREFCQGATDDTWEALERMAAVLAALDTLKQESREADYPPPLKSQVEAVRLASDEADKESEKYFARLKPLLEEATYDGAWIHLSSHSSALYSALSTLELLRSITSPPPPPPSVPPWRRTAEGGQ